MNRVAGSDSLDSADAVRTADADTLRKGATARPVPSVLYDVVVNLGLGRPITAAGYLADAFRHTRSEPVSND